MTSTRNPPVIHMGKSGRIVAGESPSDDIHISTEPTTAVTPEPKSKPTPTASTKIKQPPDRWTFFLSRLGEEDPKWRRITVGGCVKLAYETSASAVTTALGFAYESHPRIRGSAYGWLRATAKAVSA